MVDYEPGVFGSTSGLAGRFGTERVRDFPVSGSAMTSLGIGAALAGMRPVLVHHRLDFMLYSMDAIVNWLSLWRFKSNGKSSVPITIRAIVGRGWGQGPQHSKSLHAWFAHVPGLRVAMPATAFDAKGMLLESIFGEDPVIMIEHRSLFGLKDRVPQIPYRVRLAGRVRRAGTALPRRCRMMVPFAARVAAQLAELGVQAELIDLRTVSPPTPTPSVVRQETGRLAVFDPAWNSFGVFSGVIAGLRKTRPEPACRSGAHCYPDSHTHGVSAGGVVLPDEAAAVKHIAPPVCVAVVHLRRRRTA